MHARAAASESRAQRAPGAPSASHDAVPAQIGAPRQAQAGPPSWAGYIRRQAGAGAGGKRAAEWQAGDAGVHARVRQRVGDGGGGSSDMIL